MTPGLLRAARLAGGLARRAGVGGGTSLPGLIIERAAPDLISQLAGRTRLFGCGIWVTLVRLT